MASKHSMDLTQGSVVRKLFIFAIPILLSNLLQQLYQCADIFVVGNYAVDKTVSLAAVGSTASITNLFLNLFLGLAVGANVVCANLCGSGDRDGLRRAMHSSILIAAVSGIIIGIGGFFATPFLLDKVMHSPRDVIGQATAYMQIVFIGQPGSLIFNFGAGILRSQGDTKRPMYILTATGVVNVILNLIFVAF
ncbi:MAG: MATE family efflux transporter, partial [Clostridia bacterium]|nr:MATE family efflux transporter [Clostridia bacterium]